MVLGLGYLLVLRTVHKYLLLGNVCNSLLNRPRACLFHLLNMYWRVFHKQCFMYRCLQIDPVKSSGAGVSKSLQQTSPSLKH